MTKDLEARVQALEDILAITTLKYTYLNACDAKDVPGVIETFIPAPCLIDYGPVGVFTDSKDLAKVFEEIACHDYMLESHHAHNPIINITAANEAVGDWSLTYNLINVSNSSIVTLRGKYHDLYQRLDRQWLIKETTFRGVSSLNLEIEESLLRVIFSGQA